MKQIELSKDAQERISRLRDGSEDYGFIVGNIALSQARLAQLVELGRDDDGIKPWTDDLLKVMHTLSEYTDLVLALYETSGEDANVSVEEDADLDTIIERRLICSFKLWHCLTDIGETLKNLQRIYSYCKEEDKESLDGVIGLLSDFDKEIKRPIEK